MLYMGKSKICSLSSIGLIAVVSLFGTSGCAFDGKKVSFKFVEVTAEEFGVEPDGELVTGTLGVFKGRTVTADDNNYSVSGSVAEPRPSYERREPTRHEGREATSGPKRILSLFKSWRSPPAAEQILYSQEVDMDNFDDCDEDVSEFSAYDGFGNYDVTYTCDDAIYVTVFRWSDDSIVRPMFVASDVQ